MLVVLVVSLLFMNVVYVHSRCDQVSFVNRTGWGAREPTSITNLTRKPLSFYVIHHTYLPTNCYDDESCISRVKTIQNMHQIDNKWADIGYHFLVGENGKVYEGRGWNREAAHAPGWNNDAFGICIIGDFRTQPPNDKALTAVRDWIQCGIEHGHVTKNYYIITHRQSQRPGYTECPGNGTLNVVSQWPRFCPFQNFGNLTANETIISQGLSFCEKNVKTSSAVQNYIITPIILFHLLLIYFL